MTLYDNVDPFQAAKSLRSARLAVTTLVSNSTGVVWICRNALVQSIYSDSMTNKRKPADLTVCGLKGLSGHYAFMARSNHSCS